MKKLTIYTLALLLLPAIFIIGCKKDLTVKRSPSITGSNVNFPASGSTMVSTVGNGYYTFVAPADNGGVYALRGYTDTIYKIDATGNKTIFYAPAATDTAVNILNSLTTDSLGNVYTLCFTSLTAKIVKISPAGVATTYVDGLVSYKNAGGIINIDIDNTGNLYLTNYNGIYKIAPGGTISQISTEQVASFAIDDAGNLVIAHDNTIGRMTPAGVETRIAGTGSYGSKDGPAATATFNIIHEVACDNKGNIFVSEIKNGYTNQLREITITDTVYTLISSLDGHVDGAITGAKIGPASFLVNDAAGNLYFPEGTNTFDGSAKNDIRKITF